jgi:hypothetical protein
MRPSWGSPKKVDERVLSHICLTETAPILRQFNDKDRLIAATRGASDNSPVWSFNEEFLYKSLLLSLRQFSTKVLCCAISNVLVAYGPQVRSVKLAPSVPDFQEPHVVFRARTGEAKELDVPAQSTGREVPGPDQPRGPWPV